LKVPFTGIWLEADPAKLMQRVEARHNDASDATTDTVRGQLESGVGKVSPAWTRVDAGGAAGDTVQRATAALGLDNPQT